MVRTLGAFALFALMAVAAILALMGYVDRTSEVRRASALSAGEVMPPPATSTEFRLRLPPESSRIESKLDVTPPHLRASAKLNATTRRASTGSQSLPDLPVDQLITLNRERAFKGDAQAAYEIGAALWQCQRLPVRERELARGKPANDTVDLYEQSVQSAERWLDRCENIGVAELSQTLPWIELAAQNGSVEAMLLYGTAAIGELTPEEMLADPASLIDRRQRSMQYLFAAVNHGSTSTLSDIAHVYRRGTLVKADPVLAYAYEIAYFDTGPRTPYAQPMLDYFSQGLSEQERVRARALATRIVRACCD